MEKNKKCRLFGLLGRDINYSFSRAYFTDKFAKMGLQGCSYRNFDIPEISMFPRIISKYSDLKGLNITVPYKTHIIPYLDTLDKEADKIGAVNTVFFYRDRLRGYNTDCYGFEHSLRPHLKQYHKKALILGTGGASKAIAFVLKKLNIIYTHVSTSQQVNSIAYEALDREVVKTSTIIINCTPLGTSPNINDKPNLPYQYITRHHLLYDLVYNPSETMFMRLGRSYGATAVNGYRMLVLQAERSWEIWHSKRNADTHV